MSMNYKHSDGFHLFLTEASAAPAKISGSAHFQVPWHLETSRRTSGTSMHQGRRLSRPQGDITFTVSSASLVFGDMDMWDDWRCASAHPHRRASVDDGPVDDVP